MVGIQCWSFFMSIFQKIRTSVVNYICHSVDMHEIPLDNIEMYKILHKHAWDFKGHDKKT